MAAVWLTVAVEGITDAAVVKKILKVAKREMGPVHGQTGKHALDRQLGGFNNAARFAPWLVLRDFDSDAPCASALVQKLLPKPAAHMRLRIAVRSIEAWLMADTAAMSSFLGIQESLIPSSPESLPDPKRTLVDLAKKSRFSAIREDMVPAKGTSAKVGPGYTARLIEYARDHWRPRVAERNASSLKRCIAAVRTLK